MLGRERTKAARNVGLFPATPTMNDGRFFIDQPLTVGQHIAAPAGLLAHLKARRVAPGETVTLFNGRGGEYPARVERLDKRSAAVTVEAFVEREAESPLAVTLLQGVSKGERMDFAVQKAVELGVARIVPVLTRHCVVRLDEERGAKRRAHWQKVAISACEQCGRNVVPTIEPPVTLDKALAETDQTEVRLLLATSGDTNVKTAVGGARNVALLVGPEGGLHPDEETMAGEKGFVSLTLGPRTLRTETAAVAALAAIQTIAGDLR